jgi:uncharacterized protein DUF4232
MTGRMLGLAAFLFAAAACQGASSGQANPPQAGQDGSGQMPRPQVTSSATSAALSVGDPSPGTRGEAGRVPRCHTSQLALAFAGGQGAAGTIFLTFRLTNRGPAACTLHGFVSLQMLDAGGQPLPTRLVPNGGVFSNQPPASTFSLSPAAAGANHASTFQVAYSDVRRAADVSCPPAFELLVTPPEEPEHLSIAARGWVLAPCNRGELDVTPLRPPGVAPA